MSDALADLLTNLYQDWFAAITADGIGPLQTMLAEEWIYTNYDGLVRNKAEYLSWVATVNEPVDFVGPFDVQVERHGDVAAVFGGYRVVQQSDGPDLELRFTGLWVRRGDRWQCLAHHNSEVTG